MTHKLRRFVILVFGFMLLAALIGCGSDGQATTVPEQQAAAGSTAAPDTVVPTNANVENIAGSSLTAVATPLPPATPTKLATAAATSTPTPTSLPSPSPTATATPTDSPTFTPTPIPTETAVTVPMPEWLSYLNRFRAMANLPPLTDQESYTLGSRLHSRYMVGNNEPTAHSEEVGKPYYDPAGDQAARNANLFATSQMEANYVWSINFWVSAPFHLIELLKPSLEIVGYGEYMEKTGETQMAAVLDLGSHPAGNAAGIEYPIMFPGDGSETWIVRHSLIEWPFPLDSCPGYSAPTGPPIVLLLGNGSRTPNVTNHRFAKGDQPLESCLFDETTYRNNDPYAEKVGRQILNGSDAVVIMPRDPLGVDETYTVQVTVDGEVYTWSFSTRRGPD